MDAACGSVHSGACDDGKAEGATLLWVARNLVAVLWIGFALMLALPWPLRASFWSPAHDFGLYPHVLCEICTLMCVALCGSRVVRIARLLRCVRMCAQKVPGATRAELWCRVESEGDRWCFRNLIERRCAWYQWFKLKRRHGKRSTGCPPLILYCVLIQFVLSLGTIRPKP